MIISAIVARAENGVIGVENRLPWHLPGDLKWFKQKTLGHHIIMGRKSFESLSKPLPGRTTIILTRDKNYAHSSCFVVNSIDQALLLAYERGEKEAFILGGGHVYKQTIKLWDRLYLTEVHATPKGDTYFPSFDEKMFKTVFSEHHPADDKNRYSYTFKVYEKSV